jgi:serine/threonine protein kinase
VTLTFAEGAIVAKRFRLEAMIGEGGMGSVWAATNTNTLRRVALKVLKGERVDDPRIRKRFLREGRAASAVRHPNVVEILDVLELDDGSPAMVMELLEGEALGRKLRRELRLSLSETASVLLPVISAVGTAHALGIVHRDLKPDNIFLTRMPDGTVTVKVLDFGIAKFSVVELQGEQTEGLTGTGAIVGTPHYMSPEQVFAEEVVDYRSDIWSLGIILYECVSGVRPTRGDNFGQTMKLIATGRFPRLADIVPDLPRDVIDIVGRMLSAEKEDRPALREVQAVLEPHSQVTVLAFAEPVLVPVRATLDASSSSGALPATVASSPSARALSAPSGPSTSPSRAADRMPTTLAAPEGSPDAPRGDGGTQNSVGVTFSGQRPRVRWPLAAAAVAVAGVAVAVVFVARPASTPGGRAPTATAAAAADANATAMTAPVAVASPVVGEASAATTGATAPPSATRPTASARTRARAGERDTPVRPLASGAPSSTTAPSTPGGLVEKPPF